MASNILSGEQQQSLGCVPGALGIDKLRDWDEMVLALDWVFCVLMDSDVTQQKWPGYELYIYNDLFLKLNPQYLIILISTFCSQKSHSFMQNSHSKESQEKAVFE